MSFLLRLCSKEREVRTPRRPPAVRPGLVWTAASKGSTAAATAAARLTRRPGRPRVRARSSRSRQLPVSLPPTMWATARWSALGQMTASDSSGSKPPTGCIQLPAAASAAHLSNRYIQTQKVPPPCPASPPLRQNWSPALRTPSNPG